MRTADAAMKIGELDRQGQAVFTTEQLRSIFPERSEKTFTAGLARLVDRGVLQRAARGVYLNPRTQNRLHRLQRLVLALRPGATSYVSLATALAAYSLISQQTVGNITVMTTGRKGRFATPWGGIFLTHTKRLPEEIQALTVDRRQPLRWARPRTALEDLRRARNHWELVDLDVLNEVDEQMGLPPPTEAEERQLSFWKKLPWVIDPPKWGG